MNLTPNSNLGLPEALARWNAQWAATLRLSPELIVATFGRWPENAKCILRTPQFLILCKKDGDAFRLHLPLPVVPVLSPDSMRDDFRLIEAQARHFGCTKIIFGGGDKHIFPGIPAQVYPEAWLGFLRKTGPAVHDFVGDLHFLQSRASLVEARGKLLAPSHTDEAREVVDFIENEFPGRWAREAASDLRDNLFQPYFTYRVDGKIAGYVRLYGWLDNYWAPGVYFSKPVSGVGGLGPIGVARNRRRQGIGVQMLKQSWDVLLGKGCSTVRIDWTTEVTFYENGGLKLAQTYQPAAKALENLE